MTLGYFYCLLAFFGVIANAQVGNEKVILIRKSIFTNSSQFYY